SSGSVHCTCKTGQTGANCEFAVSNECASYPCLNGGSCSGDARGYTCKCPQGFSGKQCQRTAKPFSVLIIFAKKWKIVAAQGTRGVCECPEEWQGAACEQSNIGKQRACDPCEGQCIKPPPALNDSSLFTAFASSHMTAKKCEKTMMADPKATFYILSGTKCYIGAQPMLTQPSTDPACDTICQGSS
ncbi:hypothetical protein PMAYCL1PPCAC_16996, partial [Pristionchus mayeri]